MAATPAPVPLTSGKQANRQPPAHRRWNPAHSYGFAPAIRPRHLFEFPWYGVRGPNLADGGRNRGLSSSNSVKKPMPINEADVTLTLFLAPPDQQCALRLKRPQLRRITKPPPVVNLWRRRWINNPLMQDVNESSRSEKLRPLLRQQQMRRHSQQWPPLVAMRIVPIIIDQNPSRPAWPQHPKNLLYP